MALNPANGAQNAQARTFRIMVMGETGVGKSAMVLRVRINLHDQRLLWPWHYQVNKRCWQLKCFAALVISND